MMRLTFVSNYLTHHQVPFCDCLYKHLGDSFQFISTEPMEEERINMGWRLESHPPYEILACTPMVMDADVRKRIIESDVVILGAVSNDIIKMRIDDARGITFQYCERIFKNGMLSAIGPGAFRCRVDYQKNVKKKRVYMLCASAYLAGDLKLLQAYKDRCYCWGYFPPVKRYENVTEHKILNQILWVGRLIQWKHPELMIELAENLKNKNYKFLIKIIGDGPMRVEIQNMILEKGLEEYVLLLGSMPHLEVREHMMQAGILVATSDFAEGWGAVVNEAMNDGCAVVASHAMGSVPFLIKDGENGLIFKNGNRKDLFRCVTSLLEEPKKVVELGQIAYSTIVSTWNAECATVRFLELAKTLLEGKDVVIHEGPCSKAPILFDNWK